MKQSNLFALSKTQSYLKLLAWIFLVLFAGKFVTKDALPYFGFEIATFGNYWDFKWVLIGHISCGVVAIVIGTFQFWKAFGNKYFTIHRWMGRTYSIAIVIGTICSPILAWTSALLVNFGWAFAF